MAVRTREEIMQILNERTGDNTDDATLNLIADISDTFSHLEKAVADSGDWKKKYEENDAEWRKKYKDRFLSGGDIVEPDTTPRRTVKSFEDLFKEG